MAGGDKTFLLGVGSQKCGTTWLSRYLRSFDFADFGICEEYHVWDGVADPTWTKFSIARKARPLSLRVKDAFTFNLRPRHVRARMQADEGYYFQYFADALAPSAIRLTGDITPTYTSLPAETYARILRGFAERGIAVKAVLLIRDPVERCWSSVRMHRRKGRDSESVEIALGDEGALRGYFRSPHARSLTRYDETIRHLEAALPAESLHVGVFESMFDAASIDRLSGFLGVPAQHDRGELVINRTPKQSEISEALVSEIVHEYAEVYRYCAERFPETAERWRGFRYLEAAPPGAGRSGGSAGD